ncbi:MULTISPECIES: carboxy terminal-processing peptidase [Aestuariibaculum]|uniref:Carboxy terminal-processing peptidase n=1 Tax=Aestuariibaculum lutulentum TaxID=2920935 RepID=A0ABS9RKW7_9FLAO|nr:MULTISPECIES: carboxy terminal-processing peptidase [Aestuariibaculum]MCH4553585.1 carboxy terminal-processing peptidase [Aestuariibaculum lutulentum]MCR8668277.1 carboxy terminal-processing peptidase [Aestuariibaculum sp. M13]
MRRKYKVLLLALLLGFASCSFTTKKFDNPDKDKLLIQVITFVLENGHYDPVMFDDTFSEKLFKNYLDVLDPVKRYFYQSDYEDFAKYKLTLDDQIKATDITFFNVVHERLVKRIAEAKEIYAEVLSKPFDYTLDESFNTDYEQTGFVKNKAELKDRWRRQLKFSALSNYDDIYEEELRAKEKDPSHVMKTDAEIEKEARESTLRSIEIYFNDNLEDFQREDWFAIYVNTIVEEFDPHTYYLAPNSKEDFDQRMSGKLEGIGAQLQKRNDYIKVVSLISGGPAWRSQELEVEDLILKVKQEDEDQPVNIVGMRINDAIKYIKGPKGTKVTLTVKKVDGTIKDITLTRDVIELVDTYAKSSVVKKDGMTFGIIDLPSFYVDFKDYKNINAAKDVKTEIARLKSEGIEGLVLDLRNNGGGSLPTVVDMAGLFIKDGPVVQVRSTGKAKEVLEDRDSSISWDGPLVILVNEISASASEIMSAAMQDYKRAIIIGGKQTYGKGTVQNVINLNTMLRNNTSGDLGALALTTQKYYRINGGSVQLEGVKSDVKVPGRFSFIEVGEKDKDNPLPWDEIDSADYTPWNYFDYDAIVKSSEERMKNNQQLKLIEENAKWVKGKIDETVVSLNFKKYKAELDLNEEEAKRFEAISDYKTNLTFNSTSYERSLFEKDTTDLKEKRNRWHESLSQDVYVEEALNVLEDMKASQRLKKIVTANAEVKN